MTIFWREELSLGNTIIDTDHRYLICLVNMVSAALAHPDAESLDDLKYGVGELIDYTQLHFAREEQIQLKIGYAGFADHKVAHQKLYSKMEKIKEQVMAFEDASQIAAEGPEISQLLRSWLLDHVIKEDMKLKPLLKEYSPNLMPG